MHKCYGFVECIKFQIAIIIAEIKDHSKSTYAGHNARVPIDKFIVNNAQTSNGQLIVSHRYGDSTWKRAGLLKFSNCWAPFPTIIKFYPNASITRLNVHAHRRAPGFSRCQAELLIALTRSISHAVIRTRPPDLRYLGSPAADVFPMPMKGDASVRGRV